MKSAKNSFIKKNIARNPYEQEEKRKKIPDFEAHILKIQQKFLNETWVRKIGKKAGRKKVEVSKRVSVGS